MPAPPANQYVLTLTCPDRKGLVAEVAGFLAGHDCNITSSSQFEDPLTGRFFMRTCFDATDSAMSQGELEAAFSKVGQRLDMDWAMHDRTVKKRLIVMVSRASHCLVDVLHRCQTGILAAEIAAVVSNHPMLKRHADFYEVPFHHLPVTPDNKPEQERKLLQLVEELNVDFVVLARYMQILTADLTEQLQSRIINIHHSWLPSFKGAKPRHQAHARGVKMIGATAHYVTAGLDEGPIIAQGAISVNHSHTPEDLVKLGRDIEASVLANALKAVVENRVLLNQAKTVVF